MTRDGNLIDAADMFPMQPGLPKKLSTLTLADYAAHGVVMTETDTTRLVEVPLEAQKAFLEIAKQWGFGAPAIVQSLLHTLLAQAGFEGDAQVAVNEQTFAWSAFQKKHLPKGEGAPGTPGPEGTPRHVVGPRECDIPATSVETSLPVEKPNEPTHQVFSTGAVRDQNVAASKRSKFPARYDLISPLALRRIAETYGEGAIKYGSDNWRKGFPVSSVLNHAIAHCYTYLTGDKSEDHLAHAAWGLFTVIHFEETKRDELFDLYTTDYPPQEDAQ